MVAAFCARDGALLLCRRSSGGSRGLWELPGGKAEAGEDAMQALARELNEELGLSARYGGILFDGELPLGDKACRFVVIETMLDGEPTASTAHDAIAWVAPSDVGSYALAPLDVPVLPGLMHLVSLKKAQAVAPGESSRRFS